MQNQAPRSLTLNNLGGGGLWHDIGQEIVCHCLEDHAMVTKILNFTHRR